MSMSNVRHGTQSSSVEPPGGALEREGACALDGMLYGQNIARDVDALKNKSGGQPRPSVLLPVCMWAGRILMATA